MIRCVKCKADTNVKDKWTFPDYVARQHVCKACGHSFASYEQWDVRPAQMQPLSAHEPMTPLVTTILQNTTAHSAATQPLPAQPLPNGPVKPDGMDQDQWDILPQELREALSQ